MNTPVLTQERLKELLSYEPETGLFFWKIGRHRGNSAGIISENGYVRIKIGPKRYMAHRLAWLYMNGEFPSVSVDHIDGRRDNNRAENLRTANSSQQGMNTKLRCDNRAGLKGVRIRRDRSSFAAIISIGGKQKTLGYFKSPEAAHAAYATAAEVHFGDYRRLS
jgi:HNH endonuclease